MRAQEFGRKWKSVELSTLVSGVRNINPIRTGDKEFIYIDLSSIDQTEKSITGERVVATAETPSRARQVVSEGDVLVSTVRPNLNGVALVPPRLQDAIASTGFCVLRAKGELLDSHYLFNWIKSPPFIAEMVKKATGASYPAVTDRIILDSRIPLPPLKEQRRIADILDRADALRRLRKETLARLDELTRSIFLDMFGDPATNPKGWPVHPLEKFLEFLTSGSRGWATYYSESGSLFLRIQNVGHDELFLDDIAYVTPPKTAEAERTAVQPGDVLLSITADLGRTAVVPSGLGRAFINQHLAILRTRGLVPRFLSAFISSPACQLQIQAKNRQGVKAGLNFNDVRSIRVPLPPLPLQQEFARRVEAVEHLKTQQRAHLATLDELFASLQHRAFRGEL